MPESEMLSSKIPAQRVPVLIIDHKGVLGVSLAMQLMQKLHVVLVCARPVAAQKHLLPLLYTSLIPQLPSFSYSHIFIFWDKTLDAKRVIEACLKKAIATKGQLILVLQHRDIPEPVVKLVGSYANTKVCFVGDLFGENAYLLSSPVEAIIVQAVQKARMSLVGLGQQPVAPVYYPRFITALIKAIFFDEVASDRLFFFPSHPVSELLIAHAIQKKDPLVTLRFLKRKQTPQRVLPYAGVYVAIGEERGEKDVQQVYEEAKGKTNPFPLSPIISLEEQYVSRAVAFLKKALVCVVCVVFGMLVVGEGVGGYLLYHAKQELQQGNFAMASVQADASRLFLSLGEKGTIVPFFFAQNLGLQDQVSMLRHTQDSLFLLAQTTKELGSAGVLAQSLVQQKTKMPAKDASLLVATLSDAVVNYQALLHMPTLLPLASSLSSLKKPVEIFSAFLPSLPSLSGLEGEKRYLLLFQNNMELRPGGGFIGSYATLGITNARLTQFAIHDVYDADGQLKGHIEPPFPLRRYMKQPHLYLRDSNFSLDFAESASTAAMLYGIETGEQLDGVIGVDLSVVKEVLRRIGPVFVSGYNEWVDSESLFLLTQTHAEKDFFPGSTQKKDFLRALFLALKSRFEKEPKLMGVMAQSLLQSLEEKHIQVAFMDKSLANIAKVNGISGGVWDPRVEGESVVNDTIGINEANIGVNKVNYYVQRRVDHTVRVDDSNQLLEEVKVQYVNTSSYKWPGGDYKNYVRFVLPQKAVLKEIRINGKLQDVTAEIIDPNLYEAVGFKKPEGLEVSITREVEKQVVGFLLTIPAGHTDTVSLVYRLPVELAKRFDYNLLVYKQPGIDSFPYTFTFLDHASAIRKQPDIQQDSLGKDAHVTAVIKKDTTIDMDIIR